MVAPMVRGADPGRASPATGAGFGTPAGSVTGPGHAAATAGAFISQAPPGS
jgi:hypothetical protein